MNDPTDDSDLREQILENQRLIDELNRRLSRKTDEVRIIQEISAELNATLDLDAILNAILHAMDSVFGFQHSMILLVDDAGSTLRVAASRGYERAGIGAEVPVGQGVVGTVAKKRKLMRMGNIGTQRAYVGAVRARMTATGQAERLGEIATPPGLPNVESQVAIPLLIKDRLVGVFAVESPKQNIFDERDEVLITILANQAASAIHNALLYRAEAERRMELDAANVQLQRHSETLEEKVRERTRDLQRAQTQLVQSEKMASLGMLVAGIAHEINTPLGAIVSMHDTVFRAVDKLRTAIESASTPDRPVDPRVQTIFTLISDAAGVIRSGTERVTTIVRRLKSFARLDEAELKEVDLHEGIEDTLSLIDHELKGISLTRRYGELPRVTCYPGRLNQVMLNVLVNAKQALRDSGEITIATSRVGDRVEVTIGDNGVGIREADLLRVFDPGFTTKGVGVGTGLGLSICYQIVQEHKGEIRITSDMGKGTLVTVSLPIKPA